MTHLELVQKKRYEILRVAERYGAENVRVFGSVARGEADELSDIDFVVDLQPGRTLFDLGGMQIELESTMGRRVDVVTAKGIRNRFRHAVLAEAIAV